MSQHCPSVAFLKNLQKQKIRINLFFRVGTNKGNIIYNGTKEEITQPWWLGGRGAD